MKTDLENIRNLILAYTQLFLTHTFRLDPSQVYSPFPSPSTKNIILFQFLLPAVNNRL